MMNKTKRERGENSRTSLQTNLFVQETFAFWIFLYIFYVDSIPLFLADCFWSLSISFLASNFRHETEHSFAKSGRMLQNSEKLSLSLTDAKQGNVIYLFFISYSCVNSWGENGKKERQKEWERSHSKWKEWNMERRKGGIRKEWPSSCSLCSLSWRFIPSPFTLGCQERRLDMSSLQWEQTPRFLPCEWNRNKKEDCQGIKEEVKRGKETDETQKRPQITEEGKKRRKDTRWDVRERIKGKNNTSRTEDWQTHEMNGKE